MTTQRTKFPTRSLSVTIVLHEPANHRGFSYHGTGQSFGFHVTLLCALLCQVVGIEHLKTAGAGTTAEDTREVPWSFRPLRAPIVPKTRERVWIKTPVDAFVLHNLEEQGLTPAPAASRLTLLRRLSFDLLGLPPSPDEVERFLDDRGLGAVERLVERVLASPQYGERWGRHWLDVVRYADTGGFETDLLFPKAWRFRDYVIRSLNADKPFDRFIQEQVAGDELWPDDPEAVLGGTLYSIGPMLDESASVLGQLEYEWLTDCADTTGEAFLALSFGCARCHDHKYDPIKQTDYFAMQAIFAASDRSYPEKVRLNRIKALNGLLSETPVPKDLLDDPRCTVKLDDGTDFRLFHRAQPLVVRRLHRGELNKPQEIVAPAFPSTLSGMGEREKLDKVPPTRRRAALARWLTSSQAPLVARVLANRVWGWHFGRPIVRTPNDFGAQGEGPTHPELLDYLAGELINHGWSLRRLHRLIVLSQTYQMASVATADLLHQDPENLLLSRFPRRRLEGEEVRDAMLACSGRLNLKQFGKPIVPPLAKEELTGLFDAQKKWPVTQDRSEHTRRSIYLLVRRTFVYPMFSSFDPPELMTSCARRIQTIVPAQALALLNSPLARQQAGSFARRVAHESDSNPDKAVSLAWLLAFGRPITPQETDRALEFLKRGSPSRSDLESALTDLCLALFNANEFIFLD
jgi:Protein of unknown function (DUF1553)/Protein of unknown function (DUF1549)